jgi:hypothetical protein
LAELKTLFVDCQDENMLRAIQFFSKHLPNAKFALLHRAYKVESPSLMRELASESGSSSAALRDVLLDEATKYVSSRTEAEQMFGGSLDVPDGWGSRSGFTFTNPSLSRIAAELMVADPDAFSAFMLCGLENDRFWPLFVVFKREFSVQGRSLCAWIQSIRDSERFGSETALGLKLQSLTKGSYLPSELCFDNAGDDEDGKIWEEFVFLHFDVVLRHCGFIDYRIHGSGNRRDIRDSEEQTVGKAGWLNAGSESTLPCDIKFKIGEEVFYVEVKGAGGKTIQLSASQVECAMERKDHYILVIVDRMTKTMTSIVNPAGKFLDKSLRCDWKVRWQS